MATYCFDIDGTIFQTPGSDYRNSKPIPHRIAVVNKLFEEGHQITFFTARGTITGIDWRELTETQLEQWGVRYHRLISGKPHADLYIDDKGSNDKDFFSKADAGQSQADQVGEESAHHL
jgi:carbamoyl-phosphate synthase large subunit